MSASVLTPAAKAETPCSTRVEFDFTHCDDSGSVSHVVEPIADPYEEFEIAFMKLISGPLYVPTGEVLP